MDSIKSRADRVLKWSEGIFKTDMTYIAKSGFWLSVGQAIALGSSFILSIVFANTLPKEVYGNYKFILSATGILGTLSLTGLGTVVTQAVARGKDAVLGDAVKTQLRWGSLVVGGALITALYYYINDNTVLFISFLLAGAAYPVINAFGLYGSYLNGKKDFKASTLYWSISQIVSVSLLIVASLVSKNILALVIAYFLGNAATTYYFYSHTKKTRSFNNEKDDSIITYGIHISAMNIFGAVANQLDKILVFHYLGAIELAVYSFALAIPEQIKGSYKNLFNIALPKYAERSNADLRRSVVQKTIQLTAMTAILVLAYIVAAPFIYKIFFPRYVDSIWYSQIYSLGLLAIPCISLFGTYFQLNHDTKTLYKLSLISNGVTIFLTFFLIKHFGLHGAVIENGLSWLVMMLTNIFFFAGHKPTATV